jgi:hypothetical protein
MARKLSEVAKSFDALADRIEKTWGPHYPISKPLKTTMSASGPALTPQDAMNMAHSISERILGLTDGKDPSETEADDYWDWFGSQADQLDFGSITSDPVSITRSTFEFLMFVSCELPPQAASVDWDRVKDSSLVPKRLAARIKALESRLAALEPRANLVDEKIKVIEDAHDAAERLPTDLQELRTSAEEIDSLQASSSQANFRIGEYLRTSTENEGTIIELRKKAAALVERCEEAYRITTSAGLAGAFEYRSKSLAKVGWIWVVILVLSLAAAVLLGKDRYDGLKSLLTGEHPSALVYLNILFAVLGVAAPVWLAWLATRSIGQSFRLSEDYAFKASVSKAYEGYRKEAVSLDESFAKRLFGSALTRLDEAPSRFIVAEDHNSPLQELLQNESFKKFLAAFPEVQDKLGKYIVDAKSAVSGAVGGAVAGAATAKKPLKEPAKGESGAADTEA